MIFYSKLGVKYLKNNMNKELVLMCSECNNPVDIMSVRQTGDNDVKIVFICPYCGVGKTEFHYLYTKDK